MREQFIAGWLRQKEHLFFIFRKRDICKNGGITVSKKILWKNTRLSFFDFFEKGTNALE